jgi:hypothetical protein
VTLYVRSGAPTVVRRIYCSAESDSGAAENLLENGRQTGQYPAELLRERLQRPGALAQPFTCCDCLGSVVAIVSEKCLGSGDHGNLEVKRETAKSRFQCVCLIRQQCNWPGRDSFPLFICTGPGAVI